MDIKYDIMKPKGRYFMVIIDSAIANMNLVDENFYDMNFIEKAHRVAVFYFDSPVTGGVAFFDESP